MILSFLRPDGQLYYRRKCGPMPTEVALLMAQPGVQKVTITHNDGYLTEYSKT